LLRFLEKSSRQKIANSFTGEESSFYLENPQNSMWLAFGVPRPTIVRRNIEARKVLIWICFSRFGSYDVGMLPPGEKFNRDFFIDEVSERYDEH
jgi:hypothetical protein